jgi:Fe-S-cluster containining protein
MKDAIHMSAVADPPANPGEWLAAYLGTREGLAAAESDFQCEPACRRPGCRHPDLQIPVSLIDLAAAARSRGESVWAFFRQHYAVGLFADERDDWLRRVALRLQKPCAFLENDLCSIYPVRPLACMLFPEYLAAEGKVEENAARAHFRDYLCLQRPLSLSAARRRLMNDLKDLWEREKLISSHYLFEESSCYLDFGNLTGELVEEAGNGAGAEGSWEAGQPHIIPNRVMEHYFDKHLARHEPFAGVEAKLRQLDNDETVGQLLTWLADERLIKRLKREGDGRVKVFRFVKGRLKGTRRSLVRSVHAY